ncbi:hypothetical protein BKA65DRAFT_476888 [Rhexocercosporidium sp. MPI-PUGE-AT-0058]|nr:hypothetical protein BKA65DRAFT_476888 [Rhexocercosporidium sp. MPI-PUGE-AT-0058]
MLRGEQLSQKAGSEGPENIVCSSNVNGVILDSLIVVETAQESLHRKSPSPNAHHTFETDLHRTSQRPSHTTPKVNITRTKNPNSTPPMLEGPLISPWSKLQQDWQCQSSIQKIQDEFIKMHIQKSLIISTLLSLSAAQKSSKSIDHSLLFPLPHYLISAIYSDRIRLTSSEYTPPRRGTEDLRPTHRSYKYCFPRWRQNQQRKAKATPTSNPASLPADELLPREEVGGFNFESLQVRQDDPKIPFVDSILAREPGV